jgi:hypothetical protein
MIARGQEGIGKVGVIVVSLLIVAVVITGYVWGTLR